MPLPKEKDIRFLTLPFQVSPTLKEGNPNLNRLLLVFQKAATDHINELKLDSAHLSDTQKMLYVVCRMKGEFAKPFLPDEKLTLVTYPLAPEFISFSREAYCLNSDNEIVFKLSSTWVLIDGDSRRLLSTKAFKKKAEENKVCLDDMTPVFQEPLFDLPKEGRKEKEDSFYIVRKEDIDNNGHMNNTVYIKLGQDLFLHKTIRQFEIGFEKECFLGERLSLCSYEYNDHLIVQGYKENGEISFKIKFSY